MRLRIPPMPPPLASASVSRERELPVAARQPLLSLAFRPTLPRLPIPHCRRGHRTFDTNETLISDVNVSVLTVASNTRTPQSSPLNPEQTAHLPSVTGQVEGSPPRQWPTARGATAFVCRRRLLYRAATRAKSICCSTRRSRSVISPETRKCTHSGTPRSILIRLTERLQERPDRGRCEAV